MGNSAISERILCYADFLFGFGRNVYDVGGNTGQWRGGESYELFSLDRHRTIPAVPPKNPNDRRDKGKPTVLKYHWMCRVPRLVHALVVTGETVFDAGLREFRLLRSPRGPSQFPAHLQGFSKDLPLPVISTYGLLIIAVPVQ